MKFTDALIESAIAELLRFERYPDVMDEAIAQKPNGTGNIQTFRWGNSRNFGIDLGRSVGVVLRSWGRLR